MSTLPNITPEVIKTYQDEVARNSSPATAKRKVVSLNRFFDWAAGEGHIQANPIGAGVDTNAFVVTPKKAKVGVRVWATVGITGSLAVLIFLLLYELKFPIPFIRSSAQESQIQTLQNQNIPATPEASIPANSAVNGSWDLYAKLKLTDASGNPQVGSETLSFKLYNAGQGGDALYTSDSQTVTTDANGSTLVSLSNVPQDLFFQNNTLFLEPSVASGSSSVRIPVSTASTPANLEGYYPASPDTGAGPSTVPVLDSNGSLNLASQSPAINAKSGNLLIQGQTITVKATDGGGGNIEINPDANGYAHFLFEGNHSNFLNAQAPNLTTGSLYYGMVPNNATGYYFLKLQSGAPAMTTKYSIDALGNTNQTGNLATNGVTRLTSGGTLENITGYSQNSGDFTVNQNPGDFAAINKTITSGSALSDVLTLTLDERGKPATQNSDYSTLVLNRYDGSGAAAALKVNTGNAIFNGQLELGRYDTNPSAIGEGSLVFNSTDKQVYFWNGTAWVPVGTATTVPFSGLLTGVNTTATMTVGSGASLTYSGSGTINASSLEGGTWAAPGAIGSATPNSGAFTDLSASGTVKFSGLSPSKAVFTDASDNLTSTGSVPVSQGGTGFSTYTIGDLLYADTTSSLARLNDVAAGNVLVSGGVGAIPGWGKVVLGTDTTGNYVSSVTGTTNQIGASPSTGDVTLSIPSDFRAPGTVNAVNGIYTGATAGTQRIDATGNLTSIGTTQFNTVTYTWPGADGGTGQVLSTNGGGLLSWTSALTDSSVFWTQNGLTGVLYPKNNSVDVLVGSDSTPSAKFAFTGVAGGLPTASIAGNIANVDTYLTGNGNLATTNMADLTLGSSSTGNVVINSRGSTSLTANAANLTASGTLTLPNTNTLTGVVGYLQNSQGYSVGGGTTYHFDSSGNINAATIATGGTQRIDATGDLTNIGTTQFNTVTYTWPGADGSTGQVLSTNGGAGLSWVNALTDSSVYWIQNALIGVLYPKNNTVDVLIGANSTASAKFAFTGVAGGLPTASIAGDIANVATYLTGDGTLSTTNAQGLTLGSSTTGNVILNSRGSTALTVNGFNLTAGGTVTLLNSNTLTGVANYLQNSQGYSVGGGTTYYFDGSGNLNANAGTFAGVVTIPNSNTITGVSNYAELNNGLSVGGGTTYYFDKNGNINANTIATGATQRIDVTGDLTNISTTQINGLTYTWPGSQTPNYVLQTNGLGTLSWVDPAAAVALSIFWTSANGALFPKNNTLDVLIGANATSSAKFAFTGVNSGLPTASIAGDIAGVATYLTGDGNLATTNMTDLTLGGATTGNVVSNSPFVANYTITLPNSNTLTGVTGYLQNSQGYSVGGGTTYYFDGSGNINANAGTFAGTVTIPNTNTITGVSNYAELNNGLSVGGGTTYYFDKNGNINANTIATGGTQRIDASGDLTSIGTTQLNGVTYTWPASATANYVLQSQNTGSSSTLVWVDPAAAVASNIYWTQANGAVFPKNNTVDVLIGSDATSSAKFAFTGVNSGVPTASIAGNIANVATFIDGNGNISTTNDQNLTLGNSSTYNSTGNILLNPNGTGDVGIGTTSPNNTLEVAGVIANNPSGATLPSSYTYAFRTGSPVGTVPWGLLQNATDSQHPTLAALETSSGVLGFLASNYVNSTGLFEVAAASSRNLGFSAGGRVANSVQMILTSAGNVGIGTTSPTALLDVNGNASVSGTLAFHAGTGTIQSTTFSPLVIGGNTTGNITLSPSNDIAGGNVSPNVTNVTDLGTSSLLYRNIYGTSIYQGTYQVCDSSGANCPASTFYWSQANGALYPTNNSVDLLLGSSATSSAKFAFTGVNSGVPTASIAGNIANVATFIDGNGNISTTNDQNLTLGNSSTYNSTGNILLNPNGTGDVGIGTTSPSQLLSVGSINNFTVNSIGNIFQTFSGAPAAPAGTFKILTMSPSGTFPWGLMQNASYTSQPNLINLYTAEGGSATSLGYIFASDINSTPGVGITADTGRQLTFHTNGAYASPSMIITTTGNVGVGTNTPTALLDVAGNASISGTLAFHTGTGTIQSTTFSPLVLGGNTTGNITLSPSNDIAGGNVSPNVNNVTDLGTSSLAFRNIYGETLSTGGTQRIDASGNLTSIGTTQLNGVTYTWPASATANYVLQSGGTGSSSTLSWVDPAAAVASNIYWTQANGALFPKNSSLDVLIGSNATSSAKIAFTGVNGGLPTASIAGNIANVATYLTGDGTLSTTNAQGLTLGGSTTGNVIINSRGSNALIANGANLTAGGTLTFPNSNTLTGVANYLQNSQGYSVGGGTTYYFDSSGNLNANAGTFAGVVTIPNSNTITGVSNYAELNNGLSVGGGTTYYFDSSGNINANTIATGATQRIDAAGDLTNIGTTQLNGVTYTWPASATANYILQSGGTGSSSTLSWVDPAAAVASSIYWTSGNGALYPKNNTLDVLIGATAGTTATQSAKFAFTGVNSGVPTASIAGNIANVATFIDGNGNISTTNDQNLVLGNSATYNSTGNILLNPNGTGNVGVGTNGPNDKLDVAGAIRISADSSFISGAGPRIYRNATNGLQIQGYAGSSYNFMLFTPTGAQLITNPVSTADLFLSGGGTGNVGIGALTANQRLSVNGSLSVYKGTELSYSPTTTDIVASNDSANSRFLLAQSTGAYGGLIWNYNATPANGFLGIGTNGSNQMVINQSGNVGIGTTSPTALLDVNGNASVSGTLAFHAGTGTIQTTTFSPLVIGGNTTGNITLSPSNDISGGFIAPNVANVTDIGTSANYFRNIFGGIVNAVISVNTGSGTGTARIDASGNLTSIGTTQLHGITYTWPGSDAAVSGYVLSSNGAGALSWVAQTGVGGGGGWTQGALGVLYPSILTTDVLIGANSTSSATFAFKNILTGTPTLDVSHQATNIAVKDNTTNSLQILEGANPYLAINTNNGTENMSFGNSTTNPTFTFLGSGTTTLGGNLAVNGAGSADITSTTTTATVFNSTVTTLSAGGAATTLNLGPTGSGASSIVMSGGSGDTGCTLDGSNGNLACSGTITASGGISASSVSFAGITTGVNNTGQTMTVGNTSSLTYSGSGTVNASSLEGATWEAPGTIGSGTPNSGVFTSLSSNSTTNLGQGSGVVTVNSSGALNLTGASASTFAFPANTTNTLRITDGTTALLALDSRNTVTGVKAITITPSAPTISGASGTTFSSTNLAAYTLTDSSTTTVNALSGLQLNVSVPTISQSGGAVTVTKASTVYIANAPTLGGSVTCTNCFALDIGGGAIGLNGSAGTSGQVLTSGGPNAIPTWGDASALAVKWSSLTAPTAALNLTMPAGDETTFTEQSTTQTGFTWTSSTITSGVVGAFGITGSSAVATAANSGSVLTLASSTTGFTAATQALASIYSSGANTNNGVTVEGLRSSVVNTNGTSGTNIAAYLNASGATTANYALQINAGNVNSAAAIDWIAKSNTASTFRVTDGTTALLALDSRNTTGGVNALTITPPNQTIAGIAGTTYSATDHAAFTLTDSTATTVTALSGLEDYIASPTINQSGGALTVSKASTVYIADAPTLGASVTCTTCFAIDIGGGAIGLAGSAGTSGQVLTSGGANAIPTWGDASALAVKWSSLTAPTAALNLTMPAGDETAFTESSTTQTGFTWTSSTITSGMVGEFALTGSSAVATAANSGSVLTLASSTTGFTAATQALAAVYSSGANTNNGVTVEGLRSSVVNTNGTSGTNIAAYLNASGATTANYALQINAGNVNSAAAIDWIAAANTANTFRVTDGTTVLLALDSRNTITGVNALTITPSAPTITSAGTLAFSGTSLAGFTTTLTGTTGTTALNGLELNIAQPTVTDSSSHTTTTASTLYIAGAPTVGGSETITNPYALDVAAGNVYFGGNLAFASTTPSISTANTGTLSFTDGTNNMVQIVDEGTTGRLAVSDALAVGTLTTQAYSAFGTGTTNHSLTGAGNLIITGAVETHGILYLDGGQINDKFGGTDTIDIPITDHSLAQDSTTHPYSTLENGSWLVNNNDTPGIAALMVNTIYATPDIFDASKSGTNRFKIINDGSVTITTAHDSTTADLTVTDTTGAGVGKIAAGTVDPPYTINGIKYATYLPGMVGVKEEVAGQVQTNDYIPGVGYRYVIDFDNLTAGSDLWLFGKATNIVNNIESLVALLTPASPTKTWYQVDAQNHALIIYSAESTQISFRLTAPRFDSANFGNTRNPNDDLTGFVINSPDTPDTFNGNVNPITLSDFTLASAGNGSYVLKDSLGNIIDGIDSIGNFVAGNIRAGAVTTQELAANSFTAFQGTVDHLLITSGLVSPNIQTALISPIPGGSNVTVRLGTSDEALGTSQAGKLSIQNAAGQEVSSLDSQGNATFSGVVHSQNIDQIQALLNQVSTDQNVLLAATSGAVLNATNSANISNLIASDLYVTNQAAINSLSVTNNLAVGSDFVITQALGTSTEGTSINTLSGPLKLQSLALAPVEIMNGLVTIDTKGNVNIAGDLNVAGNVHATSYKLQATSPEGNPLAQIDASGSANFNSVTTPQLVVAAADATQAGTIVNGVITTNSTIGQAVIPAGVSEITIKNPKVTDYTLVYITPTSTTNNYVLYVKSKQNGQFVVGFDNPLTTDVTFNWWIVQVQ